MSKAAKFYKEMQKLNWAFKCENTYNIDNEWDMSAATDEATYNCAYWLIHDKILLESLIQARLELEEVNSEYYGKLDLNNIRGGHE